MTGLYISFRLLSFNAVLCTKLTSVVGLLLQQVRYAKPTRVAHAEKEEIRSRHRSVGWILMRERERDSLGAAVVSASTAGSRAKAFSLREKRLGLQHRGRYESCYLDLSGVKLTRGSSCGYRLTYMESAATEINVETTCKFWYSGCIGIISSPFWSNLPKRSAKTTHKMTRYLFILARSLFRFK